MNMILNLAGKAVVILDVGKGKIVGIIENDLGLIRYILKIFREFELSSNNDYLQFENKIGETYLHRVILEYYSQFNTKLFTILSDSSSYEVNHKNKNRWDNRLENLELVTKLGNQKHKTGLAYEDEIVMSTEELLKIKENLQQEKQYNADKKYLEKVNHNNMVYLMSENDYIKLKKEFFDNLYIRFNNTTLLQHTIFSMLTPINNLTILNSSIKYILKNTFSNKNTYIITNYNIYRTNNILHNNLKLLYKYYKLNKYFRAVCNKYNLLNTSISSNDTKYLEHNILIDLFCFLLPNPLPINFYKNQLYISTSIKDITLAFKKYNSFKVLYLLQLLERKRVYYDHYKHTASSFIIPKYTDGLFNTIVLARSQDLLEQNLSTITHTILTKNSSLEIADRVYQNSLSTRTTKRNLITIEDIKTVLSTVLLDKIKLYGFITINDLREEISVLNYNRKVAGQPFIEIKDTDNKFLTKMVGNLTEIKDLMKELKIEYKTINRNTKLKINEYQQKNGIEETTTIGLTYQQRVIILKKLYVESRKRPTNRNKSKK